MDAAAINALTDIDVLRALVLEKIDTIAQRDTLYMFNLVMRSDSAAGFAVTGIDLLRSSLRSPAPFISPMIFSNSANIVWRYTVPLNWSRKWLMR